MMILLLVLFIVHEADFNSHDTNIQLSYKNSW